MQARHARFVQGSSGQRSHARLTKEEMLTCDLVRRHSPPTKHSLTHLVRAFAFRDPGHIRGKSIRGFHTLCMTSQPVSVICSPHGSLYHGLWAAGRPRAFWLLRYGNVRFPTTTVTRMLLVAPRAVRQRYPLAPRNGLIWGS